MSLDLVEEDYFGLQFMDKNQVPHWLDKTKKLKKQIQIYPPTFHFRVKFYTSEPNNLVEELTRYQFFLQLKQDILSDKLPCPQEKAVTVSFDLGPNCANHSSLNTLISVRKTPTGGVYKLKTVGIYKDLNAI